MYVHRKHDNVPRLQYRPWGWQWSRYGFLAPLPRIVGPHPLPAVWRDLLVIHVGNPLIVNQFSFLKLIPKYFTTFATSTHGVSKISMRKPLLIDVKSMTCKGITKNIITQPAHERVLLQRSWISPFWVAFHVATSFSSSGESGRSLGTKQSLLPVFRPPSPQNNNNYLIWRGSSQMNVSSFFLARLTRMMCRSSNDGPTLAQIYCIKRNYKSYICEGV